MAAEASPAVDRHVPRAGARTVGARTWLALLAIVLLTAGVRFRLLDVPLERDEGEYAYAAQLMLQGIPPYEQVYSMKFPGVYVVYAAILALFGQTQRSIHFGLLLVNAATILIVFRWVWSWSGSLAALVSAASFALLSAGRGVEGLFANAEHFVVLPALGGWLLLASALPDERGRLVWSGVLLGLGIVMKQHGAVLAAGALVHVLFADWKRAPGDLRLRVLRPALLAAGAALPLALAGLLLYLAGSFDSFWFWAIKYARIYASDVTAEDAVALFTIGASNVVGSLPLIWLLAGLGLTSLAWDRSLRGRRGILVLFVVSSALSVCPGFFFRAHYFVLLLPAAAILAGLGVGSLARLPIRFLQKGVWIPAALAVLCLAVSLLQSRWYLLELSPTAVSRATFDLNPFPESLPIADYIRQRTTDGDRIAVLGSEPQICFYARRRSATGYVYTYELMRTHEHAERMQEAMIREIEQARPKFLVFVRIESSWTRRTDSPHLIFDWFNGYWPDAYAIAGLATIAREGTRYYWAPDVPWPPETHFWILVLERTD